MLKCILVSNPIKYNTCSFLPTSLIYTPTLSVNLGGKVKQHGVLLPQIYNMQL